MLASLSDIQHVLIKMEKQGLGRERNSWACPFGFTEEFFVLFVSVLKHLGVACAGSTGLGEHLTQPSGCENWEVAHQVRDISFSQGRLWIFLKEEGRQTKLEPCFHLMCFMCLPGGLWSRRNNQQASQSIPRLEASKLHSSLTWKVLELFCPTFL